MSGRQSRRARSVAFAEAKRQGLWKKGEKSLHSKWWRRLGARLFPRLRAKYDRRIGRWYKATVKRWAHEAYQAMHDPDRLEMARVRRKLAKERARKRSAALKEKLEKQGVPA